MTQRRKPSDPIRQDGGVPLARVGVLLANAVFMLTACMLTWVVPTARALRVEPTERYERSRAVAL